MNPNIAQSKEESWESCSMKESEMWKKVVNTPVVWIKATIPLKNPDCA